MKGYKILKKTKQIMEATHRLEALMSDPHSCRLLEDEFAVRNIKQRGSGSVRLFV